MTRCETQLGQRVGTPTASRSPSLHRRTSATTSSISANRCVGSAGWWETTWSIWCIDTGITRTAVPSALTEYIKYRESYDYSHHGKAGNPTTSFVPDEIVDRFCILGTADDHRRKLAELRDAGVDHVSLYLMHDGIPATMAAYGTDIIPAFSAAP